MTASFTLVKSLQFVKRSDELCKQVKTLSQKLVYYTIVILIRSALICSNIQAYNGMVEYNN